MEHSILEATHNGLNCSSISHDGSLVAGGFSDLSLKVTNPTIDPLREGLVMSLEVNLGKTGNILEFGPQNAFQVILSSPVLNEGEFKSLWKDSYLKAQVLPAFFNIRKGVDGSLEKTLTPRSHTCQTCKNCRRKLFARNPQVYGIVVQVIRFVN